MNARERKDLSFPGDPRGMSESSDEEARGEEMLSGLGMGIVIARVGASALDEV